MSVRVRFAPSPTGYVHIGSLRTALYNYLFAKKHAGVCVLRIEDTDQERFVQGAVENLLEAMDWAGISFDEGVHTGGPFGPYRQSERLKIYREHIRVLLDKGLAYPCFATADELKEMREKQIALGKAPVYDGRFRDYPKEKADARIAAGEPYVIRMRTPENGETVVDDRIRGRVVFENALIDDQVLIKSDGFPTYHFANVVDDHLMRISHVIRGEEWLPSTPKHVLLYRFFGWDAPQFAHLPLLLNSDRSKLSKRQGDVAVEDYRQKGYLPEALVNFVALLGWSPGGGDNREIFSMDELIDGFSLEHVNKSGAVFDVAKLDWLNGHYLREMEAQKRLVFLKPFMQQAGLDVSDTERTYKIAEALYPRISKAADIPRAAAIFIHDKLEISEEEALEILRPDSAETVLSAFLEKVRALDDFDATLFKSVMKEIQKEQGIKGPALWKPVRIALTGVVSGPDLPLVIDVFGRDKILSFIEQALEIRKSL